MAIGADLELAAELGARLDHDARPRRRRAPPLWRGFLLLRRRRLDLPVTRRTPALPRVPSWIDTRTRKRSRATSSKRAKRTPRPLQADRERRHHHRRVRHHVDRVTPRRDVPQRRHSCKSVESVAARILRDARRDDFRPITRLSTRVLFERF